MLLMIVDICRYWQNLYKREYYIQQTHELILRISKDFNSNDCLFVYNGANPAFKYYSFLEGLSLPNRVFREISDLHIDSKEHVKCRKIFVLLSHSSNELEKDISSSFIDAGYDTLVIKPKYHGYGTFLIIANNY
ncbi:hypothetical protein LS73_002440 [Helicobacter muridarum]|uniref:Uncharacterized protein n=1 Tax=Helicobacter muridarum TaxID=216 RepID=A0A099TZ82_9HELI|nr:hypothetical protein [Helicobacter muridarum]TLE01152.1 hypothetical protein LS73_002440 [Helicobacter muridarum]STQ86023.1 Uncharacterised protein [Helicobacter muridarum]